MEKENLRSILSEEKVDAIATDVLSKVSEKLTDQLGHNFYSKIREYLWEHHDNFLDEIFEEAFKLICGKKWNKFRDRGFDSAMLRARLYEIHREDINKLMTEQLIEENIKRYFGLFLLDEEVTGWRYTKLEEKIVDWIYCNYNAKLSKLKKLMPKKLIKENEGLREQINRLESRLRDIEDLAS